MMSYSDVKPLTSLDGFPNILQRQSPWLYPTTFTEHHNVTLYDYAFRLWLNDIKLTLPQQFYDESDSPCSDTSRVCFLVILSKKSYLDVKPETYLEGLPNILWRQSLWCHTTTFTEHNNVTSLECAFRMSVNDMIMTFSQYLIRQIRWPMFQYIHGMLCGNIVYNVIPGCKTQTSMEGFPNILGRQSIWCHSTTFTEHHKVTSLDCVFKMSVNDILAAF